MKEAQQSLKQPLSSEIALARLHRLLFQLKELCNPPSNRQHLNKVKEAIEQARNILFPARGLDESVQHGCLSKLQLLHQLAQEISEQYETLIFQSARKSWLRWSITAKHKRNVELCQAKLKLIQLLLSKSITMVSTHAESAQLEENFSLTVFDLNQVVNKIAIKPADGQVSIRFSKKELIEYIRFMPARSLRERTESNRLIEILKKLRVWPYVLREMDGAMMELKQMEQRVGSIAVGRKRKPQLDLLLKIKSKLARCQIQRKAIANPLAFDKRASARYLEHFYLKPLWNEVDAFVKANKPRFWSRVRRSLARLVNWLSSFTKTWHAPKNKPLVIKAVITPSRIAKQVMNWKKELAESLQIGTMTQAMESCEQCPVEEFQPEARQIKKRLLAIRSSLLRMTQNLTADHYEQALNNYIEAIRKTQELKMGGYLRYHEEALKRLEEEIKHQWRRLTYAYFQGKLPSVLGKPSSASSIAAEKKCSSIIQRSRPHDKNEHQKACFKDSRNKKLYVFYATVRGELNAIYAGWVAINSKLVEPHQSGFHNRYFYNIGRVVDPATVSKTASVLENAIEIAPFIGKILTAIAGVVKLGFFLFHRSEKQKKIAQIKNVHWLFAHSFAEADELFKDVAKELTTILQVQINILSFAKDSNSVEKFGQFIARKLSKELLSYATSYAGEFINPVQLRDHLINQVLQYKKESWFDKNIYARNRVILRLQPTSRDHFIGQALQETVDAQKLLNECGIVYQKSSEAPLIYYVRVFDSQDVSKRYIISKPQFYGYRPACANEIEEIGREQGILNQIRGDQGIPTQPKLEQVSEEKRFLTIQDLSSPQIRIEFKKKSFFFFGEGRVNPGKDLVSCAELRKLERKLEEKIRQNKQAINEQKETEARLEERIRQLEKENQQLKQKNKDILSELEQIERNNQQRLMYLERMFEQLSCLVEQRNLVNLPSLKKIVMGK